MSTNNIAICFSTQYAHHTARNVCRFNTGLVSTDVRIFLHNLRTGESLEDTEASLFSAALFGELNSFLEEDSAVEPQPDLEIFYIHRHGEIVWTPLDDDDLIDEEDETTGEWLYEETEPEFIEYIINKDRQCTRLSRHELAISA